MITLLILLACGGDKAAPAPAPAKVPLAETKAPDHGFVCCDSDAATSIVAAYIKLNDRLAGDDDAGAKLALTALANAAATELPTESAALAALADKPIKDKREALKPISTRLIAYAKAHTGGEAKVAEAYCPMADASWIQSGSTIANPYYGAEMLTCGSFK